MSEAITISAYEWAPDTSRGHVRDLVVRWALEEIDRPYQTELLHAGAPRSADYMEWQPFGQVPALREGDVEMFESGAILIHLGEQDERLLPHEPVARARTLSWLMAAACSIEPAVRPITTFPRYFGEQEWSGEAVAFLRPFAEARMQQLTTALGGKEWIAGEFSIADIMLTYALRTTAAAMIGDYPTLVAYLERTTARPAFQRALQAQLDDLSAPEIPEN